MERPPRDAKKRFNFTDYADFHSGNYEIPEESLGTHIKQSYTAKRKSVDSDSDFDMESVLMNESDSNVMIDDQTENTNDDMPDKIFEKCAKISINASKLNPTEVPEEASVQKFKRIAKSNRNSSTLTDESEEIDESIVSEDTVPPNVLNLVDFIFNEYTKGQKEKKKLNDNEESPKRVSTKKLLTHIKLKKQAIISKKKASLKKNKVNKKTNYEEKNNGAQMFLILFFSFTTNSILKNNFGLFLFSKNFYTY